MSAVDLTGRTFGRLTVLHRTGTHPGGYIPLWLCRCEDGNTKIVDGHSLKQGNTRSCGCLKREHSARLIRKCTRRKTAEWRCFLDVLLEQVTRHPQRASEIFVAMRSEWGECGERRLWRALRTLVDRGLVQRQGTPKDSIAEPSTYALPARQRRAA